MKTKLLLAALFAALHAVAFDTFPDLETSDRIDTESVTNVAFSVEQNATLDIRFDFNAAQYNNAELTFGCDADGDGALSVDEERLCIGWDCGNWKIVDCRDLSETCVPAVAVGAVRSYWRIRCDDSRIDTRIDNVAAYKWLGAPLDFSAFNLVKVVCRGNPSPSLSVHSPSNKYGLRITLR